MAAICLGALGEGLPRSEVSPCGAFGSRDVVRLVLVHQAESVAARRDAKTQGVVDFSTENGGFIVFS